MEPCRARKDIPTTFVLRVICVTVTVTFAISHIFVLLCVIFEIVGLAHQPPPHMDGHGHGRERRRWGRFPPAVRSPTGRGAPWPRAAPRRCSRWGPPSPTTPLAQRAVITAQNFPREWTQKGQKSDVFRGFGIQGFV